MLELQFDKINGERLFISRNHLKLNIGMLLILNVWLCLVFVMEWYRIESGVRIGFMHIHVKGQSDWVGIKEFVNQNCTSLTLDLPQRSQVCQSFLTFYDTFIIVSHLFAAYLLISL